VRQSGHQYKSARRQARRLKKRYGMRVSGRSIKTVIVPMIKKRYDTKRTRGLEFRYKKLASPKENRRETKKAPQEIRQSQKMGRLLPLSGRTLVNRGRLCHFS